MVIKLKDRLLFLLKVIISFYVILIVCYVIFYLVDTLGNGLFLDWFARKFLVTTTLENTDSGMSYVNQDISWSVLKDFLLKCFCAIVLFMAAVIYSVVHFYTRKKVKAAANEAGKLIHTYMDTENAKAEVIFSPPYGEIGTEMERVKTVMERHEQILKEESRRKSDLLTYLAHDLKTPLTSVMGYLSLLDEAPDMPEEQKEKYVGIAFDKACRLESLLNEFFEITRYNLQEIPLEKETIDLYYMLLQMMDEFYPILSAHGNTASLHADEDLKLYGDPEKLARVFNNILKNAVAYSYPDTAIEISAKETDESVEISIGNKGKTIPAQKLKSIFEKFFRLDEARGSNTGGAGLGLAIAKEIVEQHGGTLRAESKEELTVFYVLLPKRGNT